MSTRLKLVSFKEQQKTWNELKWPVKVIGWPPEAVSSILIVLLYQVLSSLFLPNSKSPSLCP